MRRTKEEAAQTRRSLLDAALEQFSSKGYQATRLADIAGAAGTTRGAIYHHFENKADLYRVLLEDATSLGNQAVQEAITAGGDIVQVLRAILVNSIKLAGADRRFRQVLALSLYRTGVDPELADLTEQRRLESEATLRGTAAYIRSAMDSGQLRSDLAPETLAKAFLAYQNGLLWIWLVGGEAFRIDEDAESLAEVLLNGMVPR